MHADIPQAADKATLRRHFAAVRRALPEAAWRRESDALQQQALATAELRNARRVFCHASLTEQREADTFGLLAALMAREVPVACPRVLPGGQLEWREIASLAALSPGAFGVLEPAHGVLWQTFEEDDLCIVPGVAWTLEGVRLGYGGGYFDRFLARFPGRTLGLALSCQVTACLPEEPHDVRVHRVLVAKPAPDAAGLKDI